jgi:hypothetical protein
VTFTLKVIEDPQAELNVTSNGPRELFLEMIEKLLPEETFCEVGDTVRFDGTAVATNAGVLMLTTTLPVEPPFFLIAMLVDER